MNPSDKLIANEMVFIFKADEHGGKILHIESRHAHDTHTSQTPPNKVWETLGDCGFEPHCHAAKPHLL